jgi:hypothetical protein
MSKLLIVGDPKGTHALAAITAGWSPLDITVWESNDRHAYAVRCISDKIEVILDDLKLTKFNALVMKFTHIIGNPPYGKNSSLAVKFLNKASELSNNISFVLPRTFRKPSIINRLNPHLHLVSDTDVGDSTFRDSIIACNQVWEVKDGVREHIVTYTRHPDFTFTTKDDADICLGRVGGGPAGKVFDEWAERSENSHYFLKVRSPVVIDNLRAIYSQLRSASLETVGCPSLSKDDCVKVYSRIYNTNV